MNTFNAHALLIMRLSKVMVSEKYHHCFKIYRAFAFDVAAVF